MISLGEMAKPGPVLDTASKTFLVKLWEPTYLQIGEDAFYAAFCRVLVESKFRPDIAEIRMAAGISIGITDPVQTLAKDSLKLILNTMRKRGWKLREIPGAYIARDDEGNILERPRYGPITPAPVFDQVTEKAILSLGYESRNAGLEVLSRHPAINLPESKSDDPSQDSFRNKLAKDIGAAWLEAFREAYIEASTS